MTKNELKIAWENGVSLDSAWVKFSRFFDHFALLALSTHPNNDDNISKHRRYEELSMGWLPKTWEGRQRKLKITTKNERNALLQEIYAGNRWAIGFHTLSDGSDEIVRIPRQLFNFVNEAGSESNGTITVDWEKREIIKTDGISYFDIRVSPSVNCDEAASRAENQNNKKSAKRSNAGRTNTREDIREKVKELLYQEHFRQMGNRTEQAQEIRAQLLGDSSRKKNDTVGYKTTVIKQIIGEVYSSKSSRDK